MNVFKKSISLLLFFCLLFTVAGCDFQAAELKAEEEEIFRTYVSLIGKDIPEIYQTLNIQEDPVYESGYYKPPVTIRFADQQFDLVLMDCVGPDTFLQSAALVKTYHYDTTDLQTVCEAIVSIASHFSRQYGTSSNKWVLENEPETVDGAYCFYFADLNAQELAEFMTRTANDGCALADSWYITENVPQCADDYVKKMAASTDDRISRSVGEHSLSNETIIAVTLQVLYSENGAYLKVVYYPLRGVAE